MIVVFVVFLVDFEANLLLSRSNLRDTIFGLGNGTLPTHATDDDVRESFVLVLRSSSTGKHLTVHLSTLHTLAKMTPRASLESVHGAHLVMLTRGDDVCIKRIVGIFSIFSPVTCLIFLCIKN